jgi:hypothetical protein
LHTYPPHFVPQERHRETANRYFWKRLITPRFQVLRRGNIHNR